MNYLSTIETFNTFSEEVKSKALKMLGAYSEVNVRREFGEFSVGVDSFLSNNYAPDYKVWYFDKKELKKQYAKEIEKAEADYDKECAECNWNAMCD